MGGGVRRTLRAAATAGDGGRRLTDGTGPVRVRRVRTDDTATRGILGASGLE
ncbi:hypothetical protein ACEYXF_33695 [Streptomyces asiaticus]|uniref:hypothetical protein n=1 Tax=Streptomyces asiaticus TaxID=114695 RepID=UPI0039BE4C47